MLQEPTGLCNTNKKPKLLDQSQSSLLPGLATLLRPKTKTSSSAALLTHSNKAHGPSPKAALQHSTTNQHKATPATRPALTHDPTRR